MRTLKEIEEFASKHRLESGDRYAIREFLKSEGFANTGDIKLCPGSKLSFEDFKKWYNEPSEDESPAALGEMIANASMSSKSEKDLELITDHVYVAYLHDTGEKLIFQFDKFASYDEIWFTICSRIDQSIDENINYMKNRSEHPEWFNFHVNSKCLFKDLIGGNIRKANFEETEVLFCELDRSDVNCEYYFCDHDGNRKIRFKVPDSIGLKMVSGYMALPFNSNTLVVYDAYERYVAIKPFRNNMPSSIKNLVLKHTRFSDLTPGCVFYDDLLDAKNESDICNYSIVTPTDQDTGYNNVSIDGPNKLVWSCENESSYVYLLCVEDIDKDKIVDWREIKSINKEPECSSNYNKCEEDEEPSPKYVADGMTLIPGIPEDEQSEGGHRRFKL